MRPALLAVLTLLGLAGPSSAWQALPGTKLWETRGDPAADMVEGIHRYLDRRTAEGVDRRAARWHRDLSSPGAYARSVEPNRERLRGLIGAVGDRTAPVVLEYVSTPDWPAKLGESDKAAVFAVRWSVYPGVEAEGLLLEPRGDTIANVVAMADCGVTPEQFAGLAPGLEPTRQVARLLAESGYRVLVPTLIDRSDEFSGNPLVRMTNLPHREWIYRMAFEAGRHPIGYEVDKVRAAVDWLGRDGRPSLPVAVVGHGEGGLIAFYAAAVDTRIGAAWVAGYFGPRESLWREPIDRNLWGLFDEFGDAEIASLIAPRALYVENCLAPVVAGPPPPRDGRSDAASGRTTTPKGPDVEAEAARLRKLVDGLPWRNLRVETAPEDRPFNAGDAPRRSFLELALGRGLASGVAGPSPWTDPRSGFDPKARMKRQLDQLVGYTQALLRTSELRRYQRWAKADASAGPGPWAASTRPYREAFHSELIGKLPPPDELSGARTARLYDEPKWTGHAVELPVWPDVVASGILLLPKDLREGERRPVVVCQHGLEGRPEDVSDPRIKSVYHAYAARLADLGYIVYAPQNPYIGHDRFRQIQRKANPLKASLFSVIVEQHRQTLRWLADLPNVDPARIAFYGLSYGGKTAVRVPAILEGYCLSICSGDFNEWVVKCTNLDRPTSYLFTVEYDMYEFGLAEHANYAEMAGLIAPRPFMVERGHSDAVAPDEWIGHEFAKVRRLYDTLGLADRAEIGYFNGGHMIHGRATFAFLARHLDWPRGRPIEGGNK